MESFEESCDRIPGSQRACSVGPTLQDLADLGIIAIPRIIGNFLAGPTPPPASPPVIAPEDHRERELDDDQISLGSISSDDLSDVEDMLDEDVFEELGEEDPEWGDLDLHAADGGDMGACTAFLWFNIRI